MIGLADCLGDVERADDGFIRRSLVNATLSVNPSVDAREVAAGRNIQGAGAGL